MDLDPKNTSSGDNEQNPLSPEKLALLDTAIKTLLGEIQPTEIYDIDEMVSIQSYDTFIALPRSGGFLTLNGSMLHHQDHGLTAPAILTISHGSRPYGPSKTNEFQFVVSDSTLFDEATPSIDDNGLVVNSQPRRYFVDHKAITTRANQLLDDPNFSPVGFPAGTTILPNMEVLPTGDISTDGETLFSQKYIGGVSVTTSVDLTDPEQAANVQRWLAATDQAKQEIGIDVTDERAERVIALLLEALETQPASPES